jgi:hypothetical protein
VYGVISGELVTRRELREPVAALGWLIPALRAAGYAFGTP